MRPPNAPRTLPVLVLCALAAALVAGCGGESDQNSDPEALLERTFGGDGESVSSGVLEVEVEAAARGDLGGSLRAGLSGPFQTRATDELPLVDLELGLEVTGGARDADFSGSLAVTDEGAFVGVDGQQYAVDQATFDAFAGRFAQSAAEQPTDGERGGALLGGLGIDPSSWLTDVTNEGAVDVAGVETVKISGTPDIAKIVADAANLDPTGALGLDGTAQLSDLVRSASIDVYTGVEDNLLRRLDLALEVEDPRQSGEVLSLDLSITLSELNSDQTIEAPADARPLDELLPGGGIPGLDPLNPAYQDCVAQAQTPQDFAACGGQEL